MDVCNNNNLDRWIRGPEDGIGEGVKSDVLIVGLSAMLLDCVQQCAATVDGAEPLHMPVIAPVHQSPRPKMAGVREVGWNRGSTVATTKDSPTTKQIDARSQRH